MASGVLEAPFVRGPSSPSPPKYSCGRPHSASGRLRRARRPVLSSPSDPAREMPPNSPGQGLVSCKC
eukprot:2209325-Alexandrium_andersonii.AAC.1